MTKAKSKSKKGAGSRERFVEEFIVDDNATQAAIRAGYAPRSARSQASRLLTKPDIQAELQAARARRSKRTEIDQDAVLIELAKLTFSNITDFVDISPAGIVIKDITTLSKELTACIESVKSTPNQFGQTVMIKLHSKTKAIELAMRHLGMMKDNLELSGGMSLADITRLAHEKIEKDGE